MRSEEIMINAISTINTSFRGHKNTTVPVTQKHMDIVSDGINKGMIEQLESLGLINKPMLKKVQKAIASRDAQISAKSVDTVFDIIKYPRYMIEQKDNGYWFETESRFDYREPVQNYAKGKKYCTPVFSREREYAVALDNIAKNGRPEDYKRLEKLLKKLFGAKQMMNHVDNLRKINETTRLHFCIPQEGNFGKLIPLNRQSAFQFVSDTLLVPLKAMLDTAAHKAAKTVR